MDRLRDLKVRLLSDDSFAIDVKPEDEVKADSALQIYFADIEKVTVEIGRIREAVARILSTCSMIFAQNNEHQEALKTEMETLIQSTNRIASSTKQRIQDLQSTCDKFKVAGRNQSRDYRLRENLISTVTRKYVEVLRSYQSAQLKYSKELKQNLSRRIRVLNPNITTEEVAGVMSSGVGVNELVSLTILQGESDSVRNHTLSVKNKYQDVLELEKSVMELTQMFQDFALLVDQQGGLLDQIEANVKNANAWVAGGNEELQETVNLQISLRYKQCCLASIVCFVLAGIIAIIILKVNGAI